MTSTVVIEENNHKKKKLLRNNEYYNMQDDFDKLYSQALTGNKFNKLYDLIIKRENILLAYRSIKKNTGSKTVGVNNKTIEYLAKMKDEELVEYVRNRLKNFHPMSVRRVVIPKGDGSQTRPIGIPTIEDRLIQQCIKQVLEPICEAKFHKHSYGFRPNRAAQHAVARAVSLINRNGLHYAVEIDIKGFFDNVNHEKLLKQMWTLGIKDKRVISIISKLLKAEVKGEGIPGKGTTQGGIISPLLSNIVLNELDWWISSQWETMKTRRAYSSTKINKSTGRTVTDNSPKIKALKTSNLKEMYIVRYADDFKVFCRDSATACKVYKATKMWLKERLNLDVNSKKSGIVNLRKKHTEFLGFKLKMILKGKKMIVKSSMTDKAKRNAIKKIKLKIDLMRSKQSQIYVARYNSTVVGIQNYYQIASDIYRDMSEIDFLVRKNLNNRTKKIRSDKGLITRLYQQRYGGTNGKKMYVCGLILFPIYHRKTVPPINFTQQICNFTEEGRKLIHDRLDCVDREILSYIMENPIPSQTIEYNDNRISLYSGQQGKCKVTGVKLEIGEMEVHHIKPKQLNGTDAYRNLIYVTYDVHKLIHVTETETINKYLNKLRLNEKELEMVNNLRDKVGNCKI